MMRVARGLFLVALVLGSSAPALATGDQPARSARWDHDTDAAMLGMDHISRAIGGAAAVGRDAADRTADVFQPERWLGSGSRAEAVYPNLFLSGARRCPGRDLILFVCKAAAAQLLQDAGLVVRSAELASDPVPFSFPVKRLWFERAERPEGREDTQAGPAPAR